MRDNSHDYSHLHAIEQRLHNEQSRLAAVAGRKGVRADRERAFRQLQIESAERELRDERKFLGLPEVDPIDTMSIDNLAAYLGLECAA